MLPSTSHCNVWMTVVKHWHKLPKEVVDVPSLEACKVRLDGSLNYLIWLKIPIHWRGVGLDDLPTQSIPWLLNTVSEKGLIHVHRSKALEEPDFGIGKVRRKLTWNCSRFSVTQTHSLSGVHQLLTCAVHSQSPGALSIYLSSYFLYFPLFLWTRIFPFHFSYSQFLKKNSATSSDHPLTLKICIHRQLMVCHVTSVAHKFNLESLL